MATLADPDTSRARAGRPKDATKRTAILEAARELFFARGVEATTIEDVAAKAGVSKVTVYGHFGDKLTLFEATVRHVVAFMEQGLLQSRPRGETLPECLHALGVPLLRFLTSPELIAFDRALSAEALRHPELAQRFFQAGPGYCRAKLAGMIAAGQERGEIEVDDPVEAAEDLMGLWYGALHKKLAMSQIATPTLAELDAHVRRTVRLFMRAYAPG